VNKVLQDPLTYKCKSRTSEVTVKNYGIEFSSRRGSNYRVIVTESSHLVRTERPQYGTIQAERRGHGTLLQRIIGEPSYKFRAVFFKQTTFDFSSTLLNQETKRRIASRQHKPAICEDASELLLVHNDETN